MTKTKTTKTNFPPYATVERGAKIYWPDNPIRVALCSEWENKTGQPNYIVSEEGERYGGAEGGRKGGRKGGIVSA